MKKIKKYKKWYRNYIEEKWLLYFDRNKRWPFEGRIMDMEFEGQA